MGHTGFDHDGGTAWTPGADRLDNWLRFTARKEQKDDFTRGFRPD